MESRAKSINITKQSGDRGSSNSTWNSNSTWQLFDRLLLLINQVVEYAFGMHIGFAFGWLVGLCAGRCYVKHFEPVYLDDLRHLSYWTAVPNTFAKLEQKITALYERGITNPGQIAELLDKSPCQIERKMNKLAKTGKISRKINSPQN